MKCVFCEQEFKPKRSTAQFCSTACRVKQARKKAAEEGDSSVVWDGSQCNTNAEEPPKPKKPSKSPTVLLKQKVKERILTKCAGKVGKSEGPSTASGEEIPADSDVPPVPGEFRQCAHGEIFIPDGNPEAFKDFEAKVFPVTNVPWPGLTDEIRSKIQKSSLAPKGLTPFLPVENHGSTNDLARSVISKVKSALPASDLDRLQRSQLRGKPKGPSSTRSSE
jgi:hypothetical protein